MKLPVAGKAPVALFLAVAALAAGLASGVAAYLRQLAEGDAVTGLGTLGGGGAVWGLYIVMDGVFLGGGVALMACACVARLGRDRDLEVVARLAVPTALVCFLSAALFALADQGRPAVALQNLARYARPESPLFATFTGVGAVCLFGSLVHFVLARRADLAVYSRRPSWWRPLRRLLAAGYRGSDGERHRRQQVGFWMSLFMLPALVVPLAALAALFTVRPGRPLWLAMAEAVAFVLSSGAVGLALLVVAAGLAGRWVGPSVALGPRGFARLGRALLLVDALAVLAVVVTQIGALQSDEEAVAACARSLLGEPYGARFFIALGLFLGAGFLLWGQAVRGGPGPRSALVGGGLAVGAVFLQRHTSLVAWQTHGLLLPYPPGNYRPSGNEIAVAAGIVCLALLLLLLALHLLPLAPATHDERPVPAPPADGRRRFLTAGWVGLGVVLTGAGLTLSLRVGTEPFLDPAFPASPVLFIAGLLVLVTAGAVYELLPEPTGAAGGERGTPFPR